MIKYVLLLTLDIILNIFQEKLVYKKFRFWEFSKITIFCDFFYEGCEILLKEETLITTHIIKLMFPYIIALISHNFISGLILINWKTKINKNNKLFY